MSHLQEFQRVSELAFYGTSFDPEKRAKSYLAGCEADLANDLESIKNATTEEVENYISGYKKKYESWMIAKGRCISTMITGPANFPVRRAEKANQSEHNRCNEFSEYREKSIKRIKKATQARKPESQKVDEAWETIKAVIIDKASTVVEIDTGVNTYSSRALFTSPIVGLIKRMAKNGQAAHVERALNLIKELNSQVKKPIISSKAKIWDLLVVAQEKKSDIEALKDKEDKEYLYDGFKVLLSYSDDRLRIVHDEKPDRATIDNIKSHGFKWSRFNTAWQRKLTNNALYVTFKIMLKDTTPINN